jgi:hypothetical protein
MKVIKSESGFLVYQKIFKQLTANSCVLVVWQNDPSSGQRYVSPAIMSTFNLNSGRFHVLLVEELSPKQDLPIYCYSKFGQIIFKSSIQRLKNTICSLSIPREIQLLEQQDAVELQKKVAQYNTSWEGRTNFAEDLRNDAIRVKSMSERSNRDQEFLNQEFNSVSLDEEDKIFAGQRESPRARPKMEKFVKLIPIGNNQASFYKLFDLSRGGLGFITSEKDLFPKGVDVEILGFEQFDLDDPLLGKVMSHRPLDDLGVEFKIGIKFNEGQD